MYAEGDRYEGEWKDGYRHGKGIHFFQNGDRYVGEWATGVPSGSGSYSTTTGIVYGGNWLNGKVSILTRIFVSLVFSQTNRNIVSWIWMFGNAKWKKI